MFNAVAADAHGDAPFIQGFFQFSRGVTARAHFGGVPMADITFIHLKPIVMLGNGDHVFCSRFTEQIRPGGGIKALRFEQGNEIPVPDFFMGTVGFDMMPILLAALDIHVPGIPFVAERGHGIYTPVDEDAELGILIPLRYLKMGEGFPIVLELSLGNHAVNFF